MTTINKISKAMHILATIARVCLIIAFVACIICLTAVANIKSDVMIRVGNNTNVAIITQDADLKKVLDESIKSLIEFDSEDVKLEGEDGEYHITVPSEYAIKKGDVILLLVSAMITLVFMYVVLFMFGRLAKHLSQSATPFTSEALCGIKNVGFCWLALAIINPVLTDIIMSKTSFADKFSFSFSINLVAILAYVAVYFIFKYGMELEQKKASESETVE